MIKVLLRLLPGTVRARAGDSLASAFEDVMADAARLPRWPQRARARSRARWDLLRFVVSEWMLVVMRGVGADGVGHDLGSAARRLARAPLFALSAIATLTLGIGAITTTFSVVNGVILAPLPYPEPERLVFLWAGWGSDDTRQFSGPEAADLQESLRSFEAIAQVKGSVRSVIADGDSPAQKGVVQSVSIDHFRTLGVRPTMGRDFVPEDEFHLTAAEQQQDDSLWPMSRVIISHEFWQRWFGGADDVIGRVITRGGHPSEVVGVTPAGFRSLFPADSGVPEIHDLHYLSPWDASAFPRDTRFVKVIARLAPETTLTQAQAELDAFAAQQRQRFPEYEQANYRIRAVPLHDEVVAGARGGLWMLFGAGGFMLLVVCVNLASLLLARATREGRELALRAAIGAGRARLLRQGLAESLLLASVGALLGCVAAYGGIAAIKALRPSNLPRLDAVSLDAPVLVFTVTISLLASVLASLVPTLRTLRVDVAQSLRDGGRSNTGHGRHRVQSTLVVAEVTLAIVLLVGGGLLLRSFAQLLRADPGFETENLLSLSLGDFDVPLGELMPLMQRVTQAVSSSPEFVEAGFMVPIPIRASAGTLAHADPATATEDSAFGVRQLRVTPGALEALGVTLVRGRLLGWQDVPDHNNLRAVVDEAFVERAWPGENPIGRRFAARRLAWWAIPSTEEFVEVEVLGVVANIRGRNVTVDDGPTVYFGYPLNEGGSPDMILRTRSANHAQHVAALRSTLDDMALDVVISDVATIDDYIALDRTPLRLVLVLIGAFGLSGTLIACTGVYAVVSHSVAERTREMGVRMALGADPRGIVQLILGQGLRLATMGIALGFVGAALLSRQLATYLFQVGAVDPLTYIGVGVLFVAITSVAAGIPARRASALDPVQTLRADG